MTEHTRRAFIGRLAQGAAAAAAAGTLIGPLFEVAEAMPIAPYRNGAIKPPDPITQAQVVVVGPRRRRRRWVCWWHRGRRVCGWRW